MAYAKIHAIKATVDKAIDYICNPEKTDEKMFVSSYACSPETAAYDFKYTLDHCRENSPNKAYHLIQAFAPGEVGFEEAHHIVKELADKLLEGKYSYVVTTHIDKEHVHNHIIFCAADNIEHNKYHDCKQSYYHIRKLSDELCKEHIERKRERKAVIPKKDYSARRLIDTSDEKFRSSPGLQRWAAIENLKIAAQSYNEVGSLAELEHKIAVKTEAGKSAKQRWWNWNTASKTLRKSSNMHSSTKTTAPIISATKKPRILTHISADTKVRSFFMAVPDVCWNRRA